MVFRRKHPRLASNNKKSQNESTVKMMASTNASRNNSSPFLLLKLPPELRDRIYHWVLPHTVCPRRTIWDSEGEPRPSIALFLINKQLHGEILHTLCRHSRFLIFAKSGLDSWDLKRLENMPDEMASVIRNVDIELDWVSKWGEDQDHLIMRRLCLYPLLKDHLRDFGCLQTLTLGWRKYRHALKVDSWENTEWGLRNALTVERAILILEPLVQLELDFPDVQIRIRGMGDQPGDPEGCVRLQDYMSKLRRDGNSSNVV